MLIKGNTIKISCIFLMLVLLMPVMAQQSSVLDAYIREGLQNNLALRQKEFNLEKNLKALKEANGMFLPSAGFESQYILANGGRSVDLPVGDMLNPAYNALNELLAAHGQQAEFPVISNQSIPFLPNDYYDTKLRVITPLINAEIYYNRRIKKEIISMVQAENNVFRRELIMNIKVAYFRYMQAVAVVKVYNSALLLVNEALRVNQKLIENQMAGPEKLLRIEAEQSQVKSQLTRAENDVITAAAFFNFLLNRIPGSDIHTDTLMMQEQSIYDLVNPEKTQSEEIDQLKSALLSAGYYYRMKKAYALPVVTNITDLGYQGYGFSFSRDDQYIMNTIQISIPLFNGFQNRHKATQAKIDTEILQNKLDEVSMQMEVREKVAESNYNSALMAEDANRHSWISSMEYFKVISRQYAAGQKSLLDLLDARNQFTNSEVNYHISHFESFIRFAELERVGSRINLESYKN